MSGSLLAAEHVAEALREHLEPKVVQASARGALYAQLWQLTAERITGGKLVRPALFLDMVAALQPADAPAIPRAETTRLAVAFELLHFSFLLHDDVIDGDLVRRGEPNLIGTLVQRCPAEVSRHPGASLHWARSSAILMGDLLLTEVHQLIARLAVTPAQRIRLLDLLEHTVSDSVIGEHKDVALSHGLLPAELASILEMSREKTATYTFELPLRAAAVMAGAEEWDQPLAAAARHLGLAFQLQDDLLSVFGAGHGKDPFSDLREGKQTAIIAFARLTSAWPLIEPEFGSSSLSEAQGARMRRLLSECGAEAFMRALIAQERDALRQVLDSSGLPEPARRVLAELAERLEGRCA